MAEWFKSGYSGGDNNCVEVGHYPWHTASYTNDRGACVEVSEGPTTGIRDTKNRELGALFFTALEWRAFLGSAQNDQR